MENKLLNLCCVYIFAIFSLSADITIAQNARRAAREEQEANASDCACIERYSELSGRGDLSEHEQEEVREFETSCSCVQEHLESQNATPENSDASLSEDANLDEDTNQSEDISDSRNLEDIDLSTLSRRERREIEALLAQQQNNELEQDDDSNNDADDDDNENVDDDDDDNENVDDGYPTYEEAGYEEESEEEDDDDYDDD